MHGAHIVIRLHNHQVQTSPVHSDLLPQNSSKSNSSRALKSESYLPSSTTPIEVETTTTTVSAPTPTRTTTGPYFECLATRRRTSNFTASLDRTLNPPCRYSWTSAPRPRTQANRTLRPSFPRATESAAKVEPAGTLMGHGWHRFWHTDSRPRRTAYDDVGSCPRYHLRLAGVFIYFDRRGMRRFISRYCTRISAIGEHGGYLI